MKVLAWLHFATDIKLPILETEFMRNPDHAWEGTFHENEKEFPSSESNFGLGTDWLTENCKPEQILWNKVCTKRKAERTQNTQNHVAS